MDLPQPPQTFTTLNEQGLIEIYNAHTGELICVQTSYRDLLKDKFENLTKITRSDGTEVWIERGIDPSLVYHKKQLAFSPTLGDLICEKIAEGMMSLREILKDFGVPYSRHLKWKRDNAEYEKNLLNAEKESGRVHYDEALALSRNSLDTKLKVETHKWAAKVNDPEKYGEKTKVTGDKDAPLRIILDTGIRREGDPGYQAPVDTVNEEVKLLGDASEAETVEYPTS